MDGPQDIRDVCLMNNDRPFKVLFVCLGNICRSPLAEGVFRSLVAENHLDQDFEIDSAGTGGWHVGQPPDRRMLITAQKNGISLSSIKARQFQQTDLVTFDLVLAMDDQNLRDILSMAGKEELPHVQLFRTYDPEPGNLQVPDPYYGGSDGFQHVFDLVHRTCSSLLSTLHPQIDSSG